MMRILNSAGVIWLLFLQFCYTLPRRNETTASTLTDIDYDVVIVGGGPAGLSALSGLSRMRRSALMIDSGEYRNGLTRHVHDIIGHDGAAPAVFREMARKQISMYPSAIIKNGTVTSIVSVYNGSMFITMDSTGQKRTSKKIVLATGLLDVLPETPGIKENWSKGIYWCPWCDGYEHRDQPLGILGSMVDVMSSFYKMVTLNKGITAFVNGTWTHENIAILNNKTSNWEVILRKNGVGIENSTIFSIERVQNGDEIKDEATNTEYDKFWVTLENGSKFQTGAFLTNFPTVQHSYLGVPLGVRISGEKMHVDTRMEAVSGVFAVGDANSDNVTNVPHAMSSGKTAAVYIHMELAKEEAVSMLGKRDEGSLAVVGEEAKKQAFKVIGADLENLWDKISRKREVSGP